MTYLIMFVVYLVIPSSFLGMFWGLALGILVAANLS